MSDQETSTYKIRLKEESAFFRKRQSAMTDNRLDFACIVIAGNSTKYTVYYIYKNFFNNTHPVFPQLLSVICYLPTSVPCNDIST